MECNSTCGNNIYQTNKYSLRRKRSVLLQKSIIINKNSRKQTIHLQKLHFFVVIVVSVLEIYR